LIVEKFQGRFVADAAMMGKSEALLVPKVPTRLIMSKRACSRAFMNVLLSVEFGVRGSRPLEERGDSKGKFPFNQG